MPNSSKILTFKTLLIAGALAGAVLIYMIFGLPGTVHGKVEQIFRHAGFETLSYRHRSAFIGIIDYKDISLDEDRFSTIGAMRILYNPVSLLLFGELHGIYISDVTLTGEIDKEGSLSLAGWSGKPGAFTDFRDAAGIVSVKNISVALLTDFMGGVSLELEGRANFKEIPAPFQIQIKTRQRYLSMHSTVQGTLRPDMSWDANFEVLRGKLQVEPYRVTRAGALGRAAGQGTDIQEVIAEIQAGGLSFFNLPWQEGVASITVQGTESFTLSLHAQSVGTQGIEMNFDAHINNEKQDVSGVIYSENLENILNYFAQNDLSLSLSNDDKAAQNITKAELRFVVDRNDEDMPQLNYEIFDAVAEDSESTGPIARGTLALPALE